MGTENFSIADMAAVCKDGNCGGMNNWMNNPFMYLIWLAYMGNGGFGFGNNRAGETVQNAEIMNQIGSLRSQIQDNQNTNTLQSSINSNHDFLHSFNNAMNMGFAGTNASINNASMTNALGQKDAQAQMASCCCDIKSNILNQTNQLQAQMASNHSADQLQSCQNQGALMSRIDQLANGVQQGFASVGFQAEKNTNAILQGQQLQTQTILNTLNNHWTQDLQAKYADAKLELSQQQQNATLIAALKTT